MPTMGFRVTVTWNGSNVIVNPDPVPTYQAKVQGDSVEVTWQASNGTFGRNAFSWKAGTDPGWLPSSSGGDLVTPVYNPAGEPNWMYNITITDNQGNPHTLDPEIENQTPPTSA